VSLVSHFSNWCLQPHPTLLSVSCNYLLNFWVIDGFRMEVGLEILSLCLDRLSSFHRKHEQEHCQLSYSKRHNGNGNWVSKVAGCWLSVMAFTATSLSYVHVWKTKIFQLKSANYRPTLDCVHGIASGNDKTNTTCLLNYSAKFGDLWSKLVFQLKPAR
jgi:hypothetical protein